MELLSLTSELWMCRDCAGPESLVLSVAPPQFFTSTEQFNRRLWGNPLHILFAQGALALPTTLLI